MNQHTRLPTPPTNQQMTIRQFLAFTRTRPDGERWELIEGAAVLSPSPTDFHQIVVANITTFLMNEKTRGGARWLPMPGIGTEVPISPNSLPQPDVFVKECGPTGKHLTDDALVIFEVLSRSNTKADREWRRQVYASVPNCQHYVTVSMTAAEVTAYDRATQWQARRVQGLENELTLPALEVTIPLATIYKYVPIGSAKTPQRRRKR